MVASRDACPLCDKPFYGKQKFIRCGVCEVRSHCACLQLGEAEKATLTAEGESVYKCNACANSSGIDMDPTNSPGSPSNEGANEGATSCASSNREVSPLISVSNQLEAIRHNGQCTVQLIESLVDMVTNLAKEVAHLKNDNLLLKEEIRNLHSHVEASPRPLREQRILLAETSRKEAASNQGMPSAASPLRPRLLYLLGQPCPTGTSLWLGFHPLGLQRYLILMDLKPLGTEIGPPPALLLQVLLSTKLSFPDSPSSVLVTRNPCWSSKKLKDPRDYLSLGLPRGYCG
ncbi:uncharacterized protein LOC117282512 [Cryptotermes secundus]|uniref:uncharacterized protein LOC117282512 n=1 Tax=Cryptotermes secundus TaxID=105785 RepID=UPI001454DB5D|nr:uncharacterized protein LOC117282512 [Cryptotermes secundus]